VVVSRHAGEAVLRGAHVFVPGVLGVSRNMQAGDPVLVLAALQDAPIR
jgi:predicted ribosome-associated RNA-binding protein Tma20